MRSTFIRKPELKLVHTFRKISAHTYNVKKKNKNEKFYRKLGRVTDEYLINYFRNNIYKNSNSTLSNFIYSFSFRKRSIQYFIWIIYHLKFKIKTIIPKKRTINLYLNVLKFLKKKKQIFLLIYIVIFYKATGLE